MKNAVLLLSALFLLLIAVHPIRAEQSPPNAQLTVSILPVSNASVCGASQVQIRFLNNGPTNIIISEIQVDLDNGPLDLVTLKSVVNSPLFTLESGQGTSTPAFSYGATLLPNNFAILTLEVGFSCDNFDFPSDWLNRSIRTYGLGRVKHPPLPATPLPFDVTSAPYNLTSVILSPQLALPSLSAAIEQPFNINVPFEVSGDGNDANFTVIVSGLPACTNLDDAEFRLSFKTFDLETTLPPVWANGKLYLTFDLNQMGLPLLNETNYPGGMGEIELRMQQLRLPCNCVPSGQTLPLEIGFTPCSNLDAPDDCLENGQVVAQKSTFLDVLVKKPATGNLSWTLVTPQTSFSLCSNTNTLLLNLKNNNNGPVYKVDLQLLNQLGYRIYSVKIGQAFYHVPINNTGTVNIDMAGNQNPLFGFEDLNGDGILEELPANKEILVEVVFEKIDPNACSFGETDACSPNCNGFVPPATLMSATAFWTNICNGPVQQNSWVRKAKLPAIPLHVKSDFEKFVYNQPETITLELKGATLEGFDDYLFQGNLQRYLCIAATGAIVEIDQVVINGQIANPVNGYYDLGLTSGNNFPDAVIQLTVHIEEICIANEVTFQFKTGFYFQNCEGCFIPLRCATASFLTPCSGGGGCEMFSGVAVQFKNETVAKTSQLSQNPVKVYPCDCISMNMTATLETVLFSDEMVIGFKVDQDQLAYFKSPDLNNTSLAVDLGNGQSYYVTLEGPFVASPSNEPYDIVYFKGTDAEHAKFVPGMVLNASLNVCMESNLDQSFTKLNYFTPVFGKTENGGVSVCFSANGPQLYGLHPSYRIDDKVTADCEEGGLYTMQLVKEGGELFSADFPGVPRVVARLENNLVFTVDNNSGNFHVLAGANCQPGPSELTIIANTLPQPNGQEHDGDVLQSYTLRYEQDCAGTVPLRIQRSISYIADSEAECKQEINQNIVKTADDFHAPEIAVELSGPKYAPNNLYPLTVRTENNGAEATKAWIQIEYDPAKLSIDPAQVSGPNSAPVQIINGTCGRSVLVIPLDNLVNPPGTILTHQILVKQLGASCNEQPILYAYGLHRCGCGPFGAYTCAASYTDRTICVDHQQSQTFKAMDTDLKVQSATCNTEPQFCEQQKRVIIFEAIGDGNLNQVTLKVTLPPGVVIQNATYEAGPFADPCSGSTGVFVPRQQLTGAGWVIPTGLLYGAQSGKTNPERKSRLLLVLGGCQNTPGTQDVVVTVSGVKPCGAVIEKQSTFKYDFIASTLPGIVNYTVLGQSINCAQKKANYNIRINGVSNIMPNANAELRVHFSSNDPNVQLMPDQSYPLTPTTLFPINIFGIANFPNGDCNFTITVTFEICYTQYCNEMPCTRCKTVATQVFTFGIGLQTGGDDRSEQIQESTLNDFSTLQSRVQPNPFSSQVQLWLKSASANPVQVVILDQIGIEVYRREYQVDAGVESLQDLDLPELPAGVYFMLLQSDSDIRQHKLIKQ
jgi:hypothetical protein